MKTIFDLMVGMKVNVVTDMTVEVPLTIKKVEQLNHSEELEPATSANDWWPPTRDWTTYKVTFTNGSVKEYHSLQEIKVIE